MKEVTRIEASNRILEYIDYVNAQTNGYHAVSATGMAIEGVYSEFNARSIVPKVNFTDIQTVERLNKTERALDSLRSGYESLFNYVLMRYVKRLKIKEIAEEKDIPLIRVKRLQNEALDMMRYFLT